MHISIFLTFGILIAKMGYGYIDTIYWLVATLLSWGISFYLLKRSSSTINAQCLSLIFCIFCMGGVLTSHQLDKKQDKPQIITEENLSSFDKTMLVTQECRNTIQKQLRSLNIQEQDFAIVSAMTLGDKTSLTKETKDIYSISVSQSYTGCQRITYRNYFPTIHSIVRRTKTQYPYHHTFHHCHLGLCHLHRNACQCYTFCYHD